MSQSPSALLLGDTDSVGIALIALNAGNTQLGVTLVTDIPAGHKFALRDHAVGDAIVKYGQVMGQATVQIRAGEHVHTQNAGMSPHGLGPAQSRGQLPPPPGTPQFRRFPAQGWSCRDAEFYRDHCLSQLFFDRVQRDCAGRE